MARPVLIMDASGDELSVGLLVEARLTNVFSVAVEGDLSGAIKRAIAEVKAKGALPQRAVLGLPAQKFSLRVLRHVPFKDPKKLDEIVELETEGLFGDMEGRATRAMPLESGALAVSIDKEFLKECIGALESTGVHPQYVTSAIFSKHLLLKGVLGHEQGGLGAQALYVDEDSFVVVKDGELTFLKAIASPADARLALMYLSAEGIALKSAFSAPGGATYLEGTGLEAKELGGLEGSPGLEALSRGYQAGFTGSVNFRSGEFADTYEERSTKRGALLFYALFAIFICVWGAYAYISRASDERRIGSIKEAIAKSYLEARPGQSAADPQYALEVALKEIKRQKTVLIGVDAQGVLLSLATAAPQEAGIRVQRMQVLPEKLALQGEASSFEGVNAFKDRVSQDKRFKDVSVSDIKQRTSGRVGFSMSAAMAR